MQKITYKHAYNIMGLNPTDAKFKEVKRLYEKAINNGDKKLLRATDFILNKSPAENNISATILTNEYYSLNDLNKYTKKPSIWNDLYNQYHVYFEKINYEINQKLYIASGIGISSALVAVLNLCSEKTNPIVVSVSGLICIISGSLISIIERKRKANDSLQIFNEYKKIHKQQKLQSNMKIEKVR